MCRLPAGQTSVWALEVHPMPTLKPSLTAGTKLLLMNPVIQRGTILLLRPSDLHVLGGGVAKLEAARQRMVDYWNRPLGCSLLTVQRRRTLQEVMTEAREVACGVAPAAAQQQGAAQGQGQQAAGLPLQQPAAQQPVQQQQQHHPHVPALQQQAGQQGPTPHQQQQQQQPAQAHWGNAQRHQQPQQQQRQLQHHLQHQQQLASQHMLPGPQLQPAAPLAQLALPPAATAGHLAQGQHTGVNSAASTVNGMAQHAPPVRSGSVGHTAQHQRSSSDANCGQFGPAQAGAPHQQLWQGSNCAGSSSGAAPLQPNGQVPWQGQQMSVAQQHSAGRSDQQAAQQVDGKECIDLADSDDENPPLATVQRPLVQSGQHITNRTAKSNVPLAKGYEHHQYEQDALADNGNAGDGDAMQWQVGADAHQAFENDDGPDPGYLSDEEQALEPVATGAPTTAATPVTSAAHLSPSSSAPQGGAAGGLQAQLQHRASAVRVANVAELVAKGQVAAAGTWLEVRLVLLLADLTSS